MNMMIERPRQAERGGVGAERRRAGLVREDEARDRLHAEIEASASANGAP